MAPEIKNSASPKQVLALAFACAIFLGQAIALIGNRWVEDESWYSIPAYTLVRTGELRNPTFAPSDYESKVDTHPPGMALAVSSAFRVLGFGTVQARVPSILAGLTTVVVTFFLGMEIGGPLVGAVAALLVATDNFLFLGARTVRPDVYTAAFAAISVLCLMVARRRQSWWLALLSGLSIGIAANFHVTVFGVIGSLGLLCLSDSLRFWKNPRVWLVALGIVAMVIPTLLWIRSDPTHIAAAKQMYVARGESAGIVQKFALEKIRYKDFLGYGSQRLPLPVQIPLRIHIVAALLVAALIVWRRNRHAFWTMMILILPTLLWWVYLVNKTVRYFALLAPMFAILLALAAEPYLRDQKRRIAAAAVLLLIALSQFAGNAFFLFKARTAQYEAVAAGLQQLIPPSGTVFGAMTFWPALHDRTFFSPDRTPFAYAQSKSPELYVIMNDRLMLHGSGFGDDNFKELREKLTVYTQQSCVRVGEVPNPFYGDLEVFQVKPGAPPAPPIPLPGTTAE